MSYNTEDVFKKHHLFGPVILFLSTNLTKKMCFLVRKVKFRDLIETVLLLRKAAVHVQH